MENDKKSCCEVPDCCDMRGMLQFLIMWILSQKSLYGSQIAEEIGRRRGDRPNPGTLYPALKELYKKGIINFENAGNRKLYFLTDTGISALNNCRNWFMQAFGDILRK
jgi:DNA-binding PadR family transcriptional regulator